MDDGCEKTDLLCTAVPTECGKCQNRHFRYSEASYKVHSRAEGFEVMLCPSRKDSVYLKPKKDESLFDM